MTGPPLRQRAAELIRYFADRVEGRAAGMRAAVALEEIERLIQIRNATSLLVWRTTTEGETVLAAWEHNELPANRLRILLEEDYEARRAALGSRS